MAFTPSSSLAPVSVTVAGTVAVSGVAGTVLVDGSAHPQPVTGPLTDAELRATPVPVSGAVATGGLTDAQLRASAVTVDGSAVTQPVSADSLPLPDGAATEGTLASANGAMQDVALTAILERDKLTA